MNYIDAKYKFVGFVPVTIGFFLDDSDPESESYDRYLVRIPDGTPIIGSMNLPDGPYKLTEEDKTKILSVICDKKNILSGKEAYELFNNGLLTYVDYHADEIAPEIDLESSIFNHKFTSCCIKSSDMHEDRVCVTLDTEYAYHSTGGRSIKIIVDYETGQYEIEAA